MYTMLEKAVSRLCVGAGRRRDGAARFARACAHLLVLFCVADRGQVMLHCLSGIVREVKGV